MEPIRFHRGFTLIELMVVFGIIVVITTVALTSQSSFNKTLILANTAYDIALTLRSAQTYGLGSRVTTSGVANTGYGLHFQTEDPFILFADTSGGPSCAGMPPDCKPGDHVYTSNNDAFVQTYTLGNGMTISNLCVLPQSSSDWSCGLSSLDIVFARPNPDAFMSANGSYSASFTKACITVTSPQGGEKYVSVGASGQITANASSCP